MAVFLSSCAVWFLSVGFSNLRVFYVNTDYIGWRFGPLRRQVSWKRLERVDWLRRSVCQRLRLRGSAGSVCIPFTVAGYVELYSLVAERVPAQAFMFSEMPLTIEKPKAWHLYLLLPVVSYATIAGLTWGVVSFLNIFGATVTLSASFAVFLAFFCAPAGVFTAWWIRRSLEEMGDRIEFRRDEIRESFQDTDFEESWPANQVVEVALAQARVVYSMGPAGSAYGVARPGQRVYLKLMDGDSIELPVDRFGLRGDKLAHSIARAYGVPLRAHYFDPATEMVPEVVQSLNLSGRGDKTQSDA